MNKTEENRLWDYADGLLDAREAEACRQWVSEDMQARRALKDICELKGVIKAMPSESPSANFTMHVMNALMAEKREYRNCQLPAKAEKFDRLITRTVVFAFIAMICICIGLLGYFVSTGHLHPLSSWHFLVPTQFTIENILQNKGVTMAFEFAAAVMVLLAADTFLKRFLFKHV